MRLVVLLRGPATACARSRSRARPLASVPAARARRRVEIALALVVGEHTRLRRYAMPGNATTATHGTVAHGALLGRGGALGGELGAAVDALRERRACTAPPRTGTRQ